MFWKHADRETPPLTTSDAATPEGEPPSQPPSQLRAHPEALTTTTPHAAPTPVTLVMLHDKNERAATVRQLEARAVRSIPVSDPAAPLDLAHNERVARIVLDERILSEHVGLLARLHARFSDDNHRVRIVIAEAVPAGEPSRLAAYLPRLMRLLGEPAFVRSV